MSHVHITSSVNESCPHNEFYEWHITKYVNVGHNSLCERVMWMWVITRSYVTWRQISAIWYMGYDSFTCAIQFIHVGTWLIHMWVVTHSYMIWRHTWMSHDSWLIQISESRLTYEWVMWYIRMRIHISEPHPSHAWAMPYIRMGHSSWLVHLWVMTGAYGTWRHMAAVWCNIHVSFICYRWLMHIWDVTHCYLTRDSCLIHMCDMTHSYVRRDSFICDTEAHGCQIMGASCLIHMCNTTHSHWDMTHSHVYHDSFMCVSWLIHVWPRGTNLP